MQLRDCSKLTINKKNDNDIPILCHDVIVNFFDTVVFLLPNLVTGQDFMSIIIAGSRVMTTFLYKQLTRYSQIGNTSVWVFSNIWILGEKVILNLAATSLTNCHWMLQNARVTAFTVSELLRTTNRRVKLPPTQIKIRIFIYYLGILFTFIQRN